MTLNNFNIFACISVYSYSAIIKRQMDKVEDEKDEEDEDEDDEG